MEREHKLVKQDMNFLEYPLWFQNDRLPPDFTWEDRDGFIYRAPYKVPVRLDGLYLMYIMLLSQNEGWVQNILVPQRQIMTACGVRPGKDHALRLKESLDRWINTTLSFEGTFYNGEEYERLQFNILNDWRVDRHTKHLRIEINKFWLEKVKQSNFFKLIDFEEYTRIRSPLAARYFELFTKNFQGRDKWLINSDKLRLKIPYTDPRPSILARQSASAIDHLSEVTNTRVSMKVDSQKRGKALFAFHLLGRKAFATGLPNETDTIQSTHENESDTPTETQVSPEPLVPQGPEPEKIGQEDLLNHTLAEEFIRIASQYREFRVDPEEDRQWFHARIEANPAYQDLDLEEQLLDWADWLETQHRLKEARKANKFPKSNFKGSFRNWLKRTLQIRAEHQTVAKAETQSQRTPTFRKEEWEPYLPWIANPPREWLEDEAN